MPLKPMELLLAQHHLGSEILEVNSAALTNSPIVSGIFRPRSEWLVVSPRESLPIYGTVRVLFYLRLCI